MHRSLLILAIGLSLLVFSSNSANAALSGTVTLSGAVPALCAIVVLPAIGATGILDLSAGDTNRTIATVTETCNDPDGYTVTVVGTNSGDHTGRFVDSVSGVQHPFTITYNGVTVPVGGIVTSTSGPGIGLARTVRITYAANTSLPSTGAFTYGETLTFTIAAK
jgi:hypothetical protein